MGSKNIPIKSHFRCAKIRLFFSQGGDHTKIKSGKNRLRIFYFFGISKNSFFEDRNRRFLRGFIVKYREKKGERDEF